MTPMFTLLTTWEGATRLSSAEFMQRFSELYRIDAARTDEDDDEDDEDDEDDDYDDEDDEDEEDDAADGRPLPWLLVSGNVSVRQSLLLKLGPGCRLVVDGNLQLIADMPDKHELYDNDMLDKVACVSGDMHLDEVWITYAWDTLVGGRIVCKSVWLTAEDDCSMRTTPWLRFDTEFVFCWFHKIDRLDLNPEAVIFILGDYGYTDALELPNPLYQWHAVVHVLDQRFVGRVMCDGSDEFAWNWDAIIPAMRRGESLYKQGFDIACYPFHQAAEEAIGAEDRRTSYLLHKKSAALSPAYYEAWFGMGYAMFRDGAWRQALEVFRRAAGLFPDDQPGMVNTALNFAALCALHTGQPVLAAELASLSITFNSDAEYTENAMGDAYRYRAEATLMAGDSDAALADLAQSARLDPHNETTRWLQGLAHHQRNEAELAQAAHARACQYNQRHAASYDTHSSSAFLFHTTNQVDWDRVDIASVGLPAKDEAYWLNYMLNDDDASLGRVPPQWRTDALCREVVEACGEENLGYAAHLPDSAFTRAIAETLMRASPHYMQTIPPRFIDKALVLLARPGTSHFSLAHVPAGVIDVDVCVRAVECGEAFANIPPQFVNKTLCLAGVSAHARTLEDVPPHLIDDDLIAAAIAHGDAYGFRNYLPDMYKTRPLLELAIARDKAALDAIPGERFDADLFAFAEQRYAQDPDWPAIVARHDRGAIERDPDADCATVCWCVFWTEAFMLAQVARDDRELSPYEIPDACFTQAVAEACFEHHPAYFYCIPKRFVTEAMSEAASLEDPGEIEHIPVALRSAAICARAIKNDAAGSLALVPLAQRSVKLCVAALLDGGDHRQVPGAVRLEVFDTLIRRHRPRFSPAMLYLNRASGALAATHPRIDLAQADYQFLLDAPANKHIGEADLDKARHGVALCHYLRGDLAQAAALWPLSPAQWAADTLGIDDEPDEPRDFDSGRFDTMMGGVDLLIKRGDHRYAMRQVDEAERMLVESGSSDAIRWAHVLDKKRYVAYELGLWDVNEAACRAAIERLQNERLWPYLTGHDVIRHTLRSSYYRLATLREHAGLPLAELQADLALFDKALALVGASEDASVLDPFRERHAGLLGMLAALQPSYKAAYHAAAALID